MQCRPLLPYRNQCVPICVQMSPEGVSKVQILYSSAPAL